VSRSRGHTRTKLETLPVVARTAADVLAGGAAVVVWVLSRGGTETVKGGRSSFQACRLVRKRRTSPSSDTIHRTRAQHQGHVGIRCTVRAQPASVHAEPLSDGDRVHLDQALLRVRQLQEAPRHTVPHQQSSRMAFEQWGQCR
jgi:hypothetical protein